jgi:hypothetical protein
MRVQLPTMKLLLLLLLGASAECARAAATLPLELPNSLSHAGLDNPESLMEALNTIELRSLQDIVSGCWTPASVPRCLRRYRQWVWGWGRARSCGDLFMHQVLQLRGRPKD